LKTFLKTSIVGAAVFGAYRQGYRLPPHTVLLDWFKIHTSGSSRQLWTGSVIATVAQTIGTVGLLAWAWSKLDVQETFTHFPAHRQSRKESMVLKKKTEVVKKLPVLDPQKYRKFELVKKVQLSSNVYHFVFALPNVTDVLGLPIGQHIAIRADIDGKSVSRSYTPISNDMDLGRIELIVKVYPGGLITNYLANLAIGNKVEIRGPKGAMKYSKEFSKSILMIAGGTGITPMYQLIRAICTDDSNNTIVKLLYANHAEEDILLKEQLDSFAAKCPKKFKIEYILSKPSGAWKGKTGFVTQDLIKEQGLSASKDTKVMLCGPPPMVKAMKNNLERLGFQLPGALSRPTDQVFLF
jgi:cytochrome-b5 reductase